MTTRSLQAGGVAEPVGPVFPEPNQFQLKWLSVPLDDFCFLGTGKGTGKSFGTLFKVLRDSQLLGENFSCLITRSSFQSLQEVQNLLMKWLPMAIPGTKYSTTTNVFELGGKKCPFGRVELAYTASSPLEQIRALERLQGRSFTTHIHDEVGNSSSSDFYDGLMGTLRAAPGIPTGVTFLANPGGAGNGWLKQRFVDPVAYDLEPMRPARFWSEEYERFVVSMTADASCNPHLDWDSYKRSVELMAGGDPAMLQALLKGVWGDVGGSYFQHCWSPRRCRHETNAQPFNLTGHSPKPFISMDFGVSAATVAYLFVPNPEDTPRGTLWMADECWISPTNRSGRDWNKGCHMSCAEQAELLLEWMGRWGLSPANTRILCDDAVWSRNGSPRGSVAGDFAASGLKLTKAEKNSTREREGLVLVANRMRAARKDHTSPWLLWSPRCSGWEATIPTIQRHPRDPETIADGAIAHGLDAARYGIAWWQQRWATGQTAVRVW